MASGHGWDREMARGAAPGTRGTNERKVPMFPRSVIDLFSARSSVRDPGHSRARLRSRGQRIVRHIAV